MSYEDRAEKHELLLHRYLTLQRRYAALGGDDPDILAERSRLSQLLVLLRTQLERLRLEEASTAVGTRPRVGRSSSTRRSSTRDVLRTVIVRCALCGFVAVYKSAIAAEEGGWGALNVSCGKGVCPACSAEEEARDRDPASED